MIILYRKGDFRSVKGFSRIFEWSVSFCAIPTKTVLYLTFDESSYRGVSLPVWPVQKPSYYTSLLFDLKHAASSPFERELLYS